MAKKIEYSNSLAALYPDLAKQWDYAVNGALKPSDVSIGSHTIVAWAGVCGHHWDAVIKDRVRGYGCPICAGKRVVPGINDLGFVFPNIAKEWDYSKNQELTPEMVTAKSKKKAWWICPKGHSYQLAIVDRANGRGCPFCGRKIVMKGQTDLESGSPFLASEWIVEKNNNVKPDEVFRNSHRKAWWNCTICGYQWEATVDSRMRGNGCPKCAKRLQTSFPEQAIFFYLKKVFKNAVNGYRAPFKRVMELDIYIPELKTGIEYDGKKWHENERALQREAAKYSICKAEGIRLVRIKENPEHADSSDCDELILSEKILDNTIKELAKSLQVSIDINTQRDRAEIYAMYVSNMRDNSFAVKYPELAKEWHPSKNGTLTPHMFTGRTDKVFWWRCSKGHDYQSSIAHRTEGSGCPYCAHRKVLPGFNDFATTHKNSLLLSEWDYVENKKIGIDPDSVMAGSKKRVFWKCSKGHTWEATIQSRVSGMGCPVCSSHLVQEGVNDLASVHPELAKEWHPVKNGDLLPTEVAPSSNKKVWWKCSRGHEWQAIIQSRHKGTGCPYCSNSKVLYGYNDLSTINPKLSAEWHPSKNGSLTPTMVTPGSGKKVWWLCNKGHEWQAVIKDRNNQHGCPYCSGKKVIPGETDLQTCYPEVAKQWDYDLNGECSPRDYLPKCNKKVWWRCSEGHIWKATIGSRANGSGCPTCANKKILGHKKRI